MMKAAREGLGTQAKLIAVTQLTSTSSPDADFQKYQTSLQESVIHYAKKQLKRAWTVSFAQLRKSNIKSKQRFYLSDTRNSSGGAAVGDQKTRHDASGCLSNR